MLTALRREGDQERAQRREGRPFLTFLRQVGAQIAHLRQERGLTQQAAAARANMDVTAWARLEAGAANSTILVFHDVSRALRVSVAEVLTPRKERSRKRGPGRPRKSTPS